MDLANIIFASALPVALMAVPMFAIWIKHREKIAELGTARQTTQNIELEERMRNLERIITDRGYDVATQIEALRDTRKVEKRIAAHQLEGNS